VAGGIAAQRNAEATLLPASGLVEDVMFRERNDSFEDPAGKLAGPPGGGIIGIAGDPELRKAVLLEEWRKHDATSRGIAVATLSRLYAVPDVTRVKEQVVSFPDPQLDPSEAALVGAAPHFKSVGGHAPMHRRHRFAKDQMELGITQLTGREEDKRRGDPERLKHGGK
jgi:hypothetical protein